MNDILSGMAVLSMIIVAFSLGFGVNLKKWYGWGQVLSGFLLGFLMAGGLVERTFFAIFFGVLTLWFGPITWKRRNQ